jgi:hypothetical protein
MTGRFLFRNAIAVSLIAFLLASCAEVETPKPAAAAAPTPPPGYWNGDGVQGSAKIVVDITLQRAYFFKGKQLVGESTVSTGKKGFSTPPGHYQVLIKDKDHVSSVFGDYVDEFGNVVKSNIDARKDPRPPGSHYDGARMPYAMFFRGGYAMHQGYVPPYAASHGCIRLPRGMADIFFDNAPVGTPVLVKESPAESYSRPEPNVGPPPVISSAPNLSPATAVAGPPAPAPVRSSTSAVAVRPPEPAPVRSSASAVAVRRAAPAPVRSPATVQVQSPSPAPVRPPAPAAIRPTPAPTPTPSRKHRRVHSRSRVRLPAPSPTPTPPQ